MNRTHTYTVKKQKDFVALHDENLARAQGNARNVRSLLIAIRFLLAGKLLYKYLVPSF
jgi:hypothetical protein